MRKKIFAFVAMCLFVAGSAFGQSRTVTGQVISGSDDEPLIGVAILVQGTNNGTATDLDGNFTLQNVPADAKLLVSYMGFVTREVKASEASKIILEEDSELLNEVVVVGYGVQKKSDLTGAVASVKETDLQNRSTTDAAAALQGKAAGIQVINSSGAPGTGADIRVRGYSSNSGNIGPLLIVDGLIVDNIQYLDPSMIQSMEVLKDAASAAIYGAQAGNGVVLITTKKGSSDGHTTVNYSGKFTLQSLGKKADLFHAAEYIDYQKYIGNLTDQLLEQNGYDGTDNDWYDSVFEHSWAQQHALTLQGGNDKGHFLTALNYVNNDGIVVGDKDTYKRLTAQINADYQIKKWLSISTNNSIEKWSKKSVTQGYGSTLNSVISIDPLTNAYISDIKDTPGEMQSHYEAGDPVPTDPSHNNDFYGTSKYLQEATGNPLFQRDKTDASSEGLNIRGNIAGNLTPVKGLTITSRLGYIIAQNSTHSYAAPYWLTNMASSTQYTISANVNTDYQYQWENFANYLNTFGKHTVGAMAGTSYIEHNFDNASISSTGENILKDTAPNFRYIDYLTSDATKTVGNAPRKTAQYSYFARLTYNYDNRYGVQANFRADAYDSSKLSTKERWGYFPSVSAGWTISNESFFKNNVSRDIVSFLKLRGSWGINGNINVLDNYRYSTSIVLNGEMYQYNPSLGNGQPTYGSMPSGLANPDLKWETSKQFDLGLDARFFRDRLTLGIDWYNKVTDDLLVRVEPVPEVGVSESWVNAGKVLNRGLEVEMGWKDHIGGLEYGVAANISTLHNEVLEVHSLLNRIDGAGISGLNNKLNTAFEAGYPIWYFRGYKYAGVDAKTGAALYYDANGEITQNPTDNDKQYLGEGIPNFTYGLTINLAYKGFDLTIFGSGVAGNEIYNLMVSADRTKTNSITTYWRDSWKQEGDQATYPDMKQVCGSWTYFSSSAAIFNGAYFKFKQIQLGYTIPSRITKKALISDLRLFVSLDDYFTITSYPGADPETASYNSGDGRGMDSGTYPTTKKAVFGVSLTF